MHSSPRPPPPCIYTSFTKSRMLPVCRVPFVLPLSFSLAVPCCDKAEAVAGMADGHGELSPACSLPALSALREGVRPWAPFVAWMWGGSQWWVLPGASLGSPVDVERWNAPLPFPGSERQALFKTLRTAIVLPFLCREGEGCCLWRFSMAILNQADRFWLLLSVCRFFLFFFSFPTKHPKHFQPLAQRSESERTSSPNDEWTARFACLCKHNVVSL